MRAWPMKAIIFINYRREDAQAAAGRLNDQLEKVFSRKSIFYDVDSLLPGLNFPREIAERVSQCDVFLAIIGRSWADAIDSAGRRRLDDPNDFVRIEIELAQRLGKRIIPVLVDGAKMPPHETVPESLRPVIQGHAVTLTHERFRADVQALVHAIGKIRTNAPRRPVSLRYLTIGALALALGALGFGLYESSLNKPAPTTLVPVTSPPVQLKPHGPPDTIETLNFDTPAPASSTPVRPKPPGPSDTMVTINSDHPSSPAFAANNPNRPTAAADNPGALVGAPTAEMIADPSLAQIQSVPTGDGSMIGIHRIGLYSCVDTGSHITCYLTYTRLGNYGAKKPVIENLFNPNSVSLVDNRHIEHQLLSAAWINGRGDRVQTMNIAEKDPVWFVLEFDGQANGATAAWIPFKAFTGGELHGQITKG
jgi:hypothetical protein